MKMKTKRAVVKSETQTPAKPEFEKPGPFFLSGSDHMRTVGDLVDVVRGTALILQASHGHIGERECESLVFGLWPTLAAMADTVDSSVFHSLGSVVNHRHVGDRTLGYLLQEELAKVRKRLAEKSARETPAA